MLNFCQTKELCRRYLLNFLRSRGLTQPYYWHYLWFWHYFLMFRFNNFYYEISQFSTISNRYGGGGVSNKFHYFVHAGCGELCRTKENCADYLKSNLHISQQRLLNLQLQDFITRCTALGVYFNCEGSLDWYRFCASKDEPNYSKNL